jgi:predicted DNA-binding transcriptional regulator AlpA
MTDLVNAGQVAEIVGISKGLVYKYARGECFIEFPVTILKERGLRFQKYWLRTEIEEWIAKYPAECRPPFYI